MILVPYPDGVGLRALKHRLMARAEGGEAWVRRREGLFADGMVRLVPAVSASAASCFMLTSLTRFRSLKPSLP